MSGVQPSQTKRKTTQVEEMHKKRKYTMKEPVITLIEDDAEFVADKGEEVVCIAEAQREDIVEKIIEFHETIQQLRRCTTRHNATT